jgi:ketol-acid reductoisomerase
VIVKKAFLQGNASTDALKNKKVVIVGYGSQGRAHALNLKESGVDTTVALRANGPTWKKAEEDGFKPMTLEEAAKHGDVFAFLTPDMAQPAVYQALEKTAKQNATLLFAHGFNIHYKQINPRQDFDVVMIAPKGPGNLVRRQYEEGQGVPCLLAVHQDATGKAFDTALAYAHGLGGTRAGVIQTTFAEETETDLFGEQAVLCGGVSELVTAGFETLVEAGYQPEIAYFECLHELKLIVDLIYEGGMERMLEFVSETAKYGDFSRGPRVVDAHVRANMKKILEEIQDGRFAKEWVKEHNDGLPKYKEYWQKDLKHPIEAVGKELRANMSWLKDKGSKKPVDRELAAAGEKK